MCEIHNVEPRLINHFMREGEQIVRQDFMGCRVCYFISNPPEYDDDLAEILYPEGIFTPDICAPEWRINLIDKVAYKI